MCAFIQKLQVIQRETYLDSFILPLLHVRVKDHPLGGLHGVGGAHRRGSLHTLLSDGQVESLTAALLIVELVSESLFLGHGIVLHCNAQTKQFKLVYNFE